MGHRGHLMIGCSLATIPVFAMLGYTDVVPYVPILLLGLAYSIAAVWCTACVPRFHVLQACLWPSIPLIVGKATVGTAMGVATSLQMIGIGVCNLVVGVLAPGSSFVAAPSHAPPAICSEARPQALEQWRHVMLFLMGNAALCVALVIVLNLVDLRTVRQHYCHPCTQLTCQGRVLNQQTKKSEPAAAPPSETDPLLN